MFTFTNKNMVISSILKTTSRYKITNYSLKESNETIKILQGYLFADITGLKMQKF